MQFTVTERLAIAQRIAERMGGPSGTRQGQRTDLVENSTKFEKGRTDEIAANGGGFGSKDTYRAAQKVVQKGTPELVQAMDEGNSNSLSIATYRLQLPIYCAILGRHWVYIQ